MTHHDPHANPRGRSSSARIVLASVTLLLSWLLMQAVHEFGHVCGALATGGTVRRVVLVPWELSRTDLQMNPQPLVVCWSGPILGVVLPIVVWLILYGRGASSAFWFRFFAGFCLIANGAYLGVGVWTHDGDAGDLLRYGAPVWNLCVFGIVTVVAGFFFWHRLGAAFGFGAEAQVVSQRAANMALIWLLFVVLAECVLATTMT